ncbi:hypothetical protein GCM10007147_26870 [Nocardiopsis kunsanensis]|uniref:DUF2087 domain-containing protein n=1 Tax=Nocardiopsis kunsanensis TaxID=141693 RepID=A0A918XEU6_9ACTN|nr:DUF2087 domain-containing protein [Nocardiopsis kunsanensis]GHD27650.1 hypothetical protein GCM10007147_26870 [Nocardiopsis kunsanensis]
MDDARLRRLSPKVLALLGEPDRLAVVASLMVGNEPPPGAGKNSPEKMVEQLEAGGVLDNGQVTTESLSALLKECLDEVRELIKEEHAPPGAKHLRQLDFRHGHLVHIPSNPAQRDKLLEWLVDSLLVDPSYQESELKVLLRTVHHDHAALRRYLVDGGYMKRDPHSGTYYPRRS